jgi:hypothetical protein
VSADYLRRLPKSGDAWDAVRAVARENPAPNIADLGNQADIVALANAYVYAATGDEAARSKAKSLVLKAVGTEAGGCTLAVGRNVLGYVLAADIIGLRNMPEGRNFANWLAAVRTKELDGRTLVSTHNDRPNNWGTHAGASRVAIAAYLGDMNDVEAAARVFQGYLGNRDMHAGFAYGDDLSWQADPSRPAGVNPPGATIDGYNVDGALPDDQRRAGGFTWPPPKENYTWEALQGAVVQAELLARLGYPAWKWQDRALLRAVTWLYEQAGFAAAGDDRWIIPLVNRAYGTSFKPDGNPATSVGKNMAFTAWTSAGLAPPEQPASCAADRMSLESWHTSCSASRYPIGDRKANAQQRVQQGANL